MRRYLLEVMILALPSWLLLSVPSAGQTGSSDTSQLQESKRDVAVPTFRLTAHEVLVDVIALNEHNQAVLDLKPDQLQVSEGPEPEPSGKHTRPSIELKASPSAVDAITSLSLLSGSDPALSQGRMLTGFRILASCLERSTAHYLLAFHPGPSGSTKGYHRLSISSRRPNIRLFYRHQYYVGLDASQPVIPVTKQENVDRLLQQSACYYPVAPLSITLRARLIDSGRKDVVRYLISADASSLSFLTIDSGSTGRILAGFDRRVAVDYGACNFDQSGEPVSYFRAPLEQLLTSADYARALDRGFPHILEVPASTHIALTRIVLRDRTTGNMGATDILLPQLTSVPASNETSAAPGTGTDRETHHSFGSVVPAGHAFCGDVYELPHTSDRLPDFRELDSIGAVYTPSLDVPNQVFSNTAGIPGVTPRTNLFGIDYHASFWVRTAGDYRFHLASDDGAILEIDDSRVIDLDGLHQVNESSGHIHLEAGLHTIHVPYYQGAVVSVALQLWVKPPGATRWAVFDLRDYQPPTPMLHTDR